MRIICLSLAFFILSTFTIGCGGSASSVKKGDRFVAMESLQEAADVQTTSDYSDGFTCYVPKGAILEALYNINSSGFFECKVVEVDGKTSEEDVYAVLVPEAVKNKDGFESFSLTFNKEYIGTKLKKVEAEK